MPLQEQLQLLLWGGLSLAVLELEAPATAAPPTGSAASAVATARGGCDGVDVLPLAGLGGPGEEGSTETAAAATAAVMEAWATRRGLAWPGEVLVCSCAGEEAGRLRQQLQLRPALAEEVAGAGAPGGGELLSFPSGEEEEWRGLRLALAHINLQRAATEAAAAGGSPAQHSAPGAQGGAKAIASAEAGLEAVHGAESGAGAARSLGGGGGGGLVVAGYVMKASRERDLAREGLLNLVPQDGLVFAPLAASLPLERQLPFHVLLHKASDELELGPGGAPAFSARMLALADFCRQHPAVSLVDPLEAAAKVINRTELARVCDSLSQLHVEDAPPGAEPAPGADGAGGVHDAPGEEPAGGRTYALRAPRSTTVASFEAEEVAAAVARLGCPAPYIVKPVVACGTPDSHSMALVLWPEALVGLQLPLPAVVQEFVNHDARIYKAYVAGDEVFHTVRPSIPNVPRCRAAAQQLAPNGVLSFDSLKSLPTSLPTSLPASLPTSPPVPPAKRPRDHPAPPPAAVPSQLLLERVAAHLRGALGLSLFGFDVVVASVEEAGGNGPAGASEVDGRRAGGPSAAQGAAVECVVVDVNYFPSYRGAPRAPELFRKAVLGAHAGQQGRQEGRAADRRDDTR
ncbi:Inositol-tetrakisphosphate 1-kinase 4 [Tetrabaena socialis]|uniref:Inositol-tetrakisphosphate 1-kinase 4 n=1 Tax=Tetrabaena socialis TaxID=47790 RepID=A0A2J7ZWF7_9CHLO|nr:Inositol-tetrakisphosphate 1-kinase 4 [Tetrabaena socialis]|eukprot:PNH04613.1 Inositol-tetrakisphosphate 1-kinase 4 [Tetrabaena socialis]